MEAPAEPALAEAAPAAETEAPEAPAEAFEILSAPRGAPDDLAKLQGAGPQLVKKLNDGGIFHYWQIAAMTPADAAKVDQDLKLNSRIERDGWIDQARTLLAG